MIRQSLLKLNYKKRVTVIDGLEGIDDAIKKFIENKRQKLSLQIQTIDTFDFKKLKDYYDFRNFEKLSLF